MFVAAKEQRWRTR